MIKYIYEPNKVLFEDNFYVHVYLLALFFWFTQD